MTVRINGNICNGCDNAREPRCVMVCPGDLLYKDRFNKSRIRDPRDCWDCAACIKECPRGAIEMLLPVQLGGRGSTLKAITEKGRMIWQLTTPEGKVLLFAIRNKITDFASNGDKNGGSDFG